MKSEILQCIAAVVASVVTTTTSFKPAMQRVSASLPGSSAERPADGAYEPSARISSAFLAYSLLCAHVAPKFLLHPL